MTQPINAVPRNREAVVWLSDTDGRTTHAYNVHPTIGATTASPGTVAGVSVCGNGWRHSESKVQDAYGGCSDCYSALEGTPPSATEPAGLRADNEYAWLIERGQPEGQSPTVWWADAGPGLMSYPTWTEDANKAYRFGTRAEADAVIDQKFTPPSVRGGPTARAVLHGFVPSSPEPVEGPDLFTELRRWIRETTTVRPEAQGGWSLEFDERLAAISRLKSAIDPNETHLSPGHIEDQRRGIPTYDEVKEMPDD